jgi:hypothetical protein
MRAIPFCFVFFMLVSFDPTTDGWMLKDQKDGICIYSRHSEISKFNDIEVQMDLPGTVNQLTTVLFDVEKYPQWAYCTKSAAPVRKIGSNELIYYSEISAPWPLANRDFYADVVLSYDSARHATSLVSRGLKDYQPQKKGLVRIPRSMAVWNITQKSDRVVHIQYVLQIDPGGCLPAWIANMFATKGPMESFGNLKKKMESLNSDYARTP